MLPIPSGAGTATPQGNQCDWRLWSGRRLGCPPEGRVSCRWGPAVGHWPLSLPSRLPLLSALPAGRPLPPCSSGDRAESCPPLPGSALRTAHKPTHGPPQLPPPPPPPRRRSSCRFQSSSSTPRGVLPGQPPPRGHRRGPGAPLRPSPRLRVPRTSTLSRVRPLETWLSAPLLAPSDTQASVSLSPWNAGCTLVHPFRPLGRNSELLVVSDEGDTATWQRRSLSLRWASGQTAQTGTEANHARYVQAPRSRAPQHRCPGRPEASVCGDRTSRAVNPRKSTAGLSRLSPPQGQRGGGYRAAPRAAAWKTGRALGINGWMGGRCTMETTRHCWGNPETRGHRAPGLGDGVTSRDAMCGLGGRAASPCAHALGLRQEEGRAGLRCKSF